MFIKHDFEIDFEITVLSNFRSSGSRIHTAKPLKTKNLLMKQNYLVVLHAFLSIIDVIFLEQYNSFLKFTQDQVMRRYGDNECSCECI